MTIAIGAKVFLKGGRECGKPGTVIRDERGRLVVFWEDMDFWSRHRPDSLELAEVHSGHSQEAA
jgi:hypothetical protein